MKDTLPDITEDFSAWYNDVVYKAELVDQSPVRGSMVIRPYGYAIWEHIKGRLDERIKATGHENASFPLFIPESFFKKEAAHVEGFSPELAVVTHAGGKELEEKLIVRPTSETIIHYMFAKWINSWRDLPLKINQWANVVRWEMRTRPFLRTTEFFWQEGHTAHATYQEALDEAQLMLKEYMDFAYEYLAVPAIAGEKSATERFPGALHTYTFEGFMPDGKALQLGTSHMLSQNFAKSFEMTYQNEHGEQQYPYLTSWGTTTRLIGATVMMHGDQKGIVLPPKVAPIQVVIIPIIRKKDDPSRIMHAVDQLVASLHTHHIRVFVDSDTQQSPGAKFYRWELKGVPLRIELGPRDLDQSVAIVTDRLGIEKTAVSLDTLGNYCREKLAWFHEILLQRATEKRDSLWYKDAKLSSFGPQLQQKAGFYQTGWCQQIACEQQLKQYQATTRCLLPDRSFETCFACDQVSAQDVLVAKAY